MKSLILAIGVFASVSCDAFASVPSFIGVGTVYGFLFAGRPTNAESSLAKVEKIDPTGWLEISMLPKGERMWVNLSQVQAVVIATQGADEIRERLIESKVYENLRRIVRHLDQATILEQRKPKTVSELFGLANGHIPLESADGEDYSKLDLMEGKIAILTITTKSGIMVTFQRKN